MPRSDVELLFLRDLLPAQRTRWEEALQGLGLAPDQERFSRPAAQVLEKSRSDPSRDTFAVVAEVHPLTGETVPGRAGPEDVMILSVVPPTTSPAVGPAV